jgi:hypothetical protein
MKLRKVSLAAMSIFMLVLSLPSQAVPIDSANNVYSFSWSYNSGSAAGVLTGTGSLTVTGFNSSNLSVLVTLNNTSSIGSNRLTSFGFGITPDATGVTFSDNDTTGMIGATLNNIPSLATIEVCAFGGQNCSGGSNGGIRGGRYDTFTVGLLGTWGSSVEIDPIGFKYQTGSGSFEFTTTPGGSVPEPGPLALFLVGAIGLAAWPRRKSA